MRNNIQDIGYNTMICRFPTMLFVHLEQGMYFQSIFILHYGNMQPKKNVTQNLHGLGDSIKIIL